MLLLIPRDDALVRSATYSTLCPGLWGIPPSPPFLAKGASWPAKSINEMWVTFFLAGLIRDMLFPQHQRCWGPIRPRQVTYHEPTSYTPKTSDLS